jgi:REP element-mobilizing transposase RayT
MPRQSRIDAPGALHHIIVRGVERKKIFKDNEDRINFLDRLGTLLLETGTSCFAWSLIPNHFHLLLRTGTPPISKLMRRLLTGHAIYFNRRYKRHGHLFQNRYKSILCQEETYLLELIRYIHLNPLRARLVSDHKKLTRYPYCGHSALMGAKKREWQDTDTVLKLFDEGISLARRRYNRFVHDGIALGKRKDLIGGGLVRSQGGWSAVIGLRMNKEYQKGDERILGDSDFVERALKQSEEELDKKAKLHIEGFGFDQALERVMALLNIASAEVMAPGKKRPVVAARSLLCFWCACELGLSQAWLARKLGLSQAAVSLAVDRGRKLVEDGCFTLLK